MTGPKGPKVVALGGGHGLAATIRAVRRYAGSTTAVVATADDGGSTGRLRSAKDMLAPDYGYTAFGSIGGVFVLGVGMLVLGIPLMLACFAFGTKRFFRGETLTAQTEVKVPDTF